MYTIQLTKNQLKAVKTAIEADIETSEYSNPDYKDVWTLTYWVHRAEALDELNLALMGRD